MRLAQTARLLRIVDLAAWFEHEQPNGDANQNADADRYENCFHDVSPRMIAESRRKSRTVPFIRPFIWPFVCGQEDSPLQAGAKGTGGGYGVICLLSLLACRRQ
jgi:hypothetical protein